MGLARRMLCYLPISELKILDFSLMILIPLSRKNLPESRVAYDLFSNIIHGHDNLYKRDEHKKIVLLALGTS